MKPSLRPCSFVFLSLVHAPKALLAANLWVFALVSVAVLPERAYSFDKSPHPSIEVGGECEEVAEPDLATVVFGVEELDSDSRKAYQRMTEKLETLRSSLIKLNLAQARMTTTALYLNERKEWEKEKLVSLGFESKATLELETKDLKGISNAINIATEQKIKNISQLAFSLSFNRMNQLKGTCLNQATKNAEYKAHQMAVSLGARLDKIVHLTEFTESSPDHQPFPGVRMEAMNAKSASSDLGLVLDPGVRKIRLKVKAVFGLRP